jgi:hypothetical protein
MREEYGRMNIHTLDPLFLELEHLERQEEITVNSFSGGAIDFNILAEAFSYLSLWDRTASSAEPFPIARFAAGKKRTPEFGA